MNVITLDNTLPRVFAGREAIPSDVWQCPLSLHRGTVYLVTAESGSGKSSLCAYLYGYRKDYSGTIAFDGRNIDSLSVGEWCEVRRRHIAYLPQEMRLSPELTAWENVQLKNRLTGYKTDSELRGLFERLGIADRMNSLAGKLSIGQQQRVALIRTVCQPCDFFLLDEPVSHLDEVNNGIVAQIISDEALKSGAAVIATSVGNNLNIKVEEVLKL